MAYEVLARKWRPQQFDQVVGQDHVTGTLQNAIRNSRVAHAYLFVGPRGVGKTSIARIMAKALNCMTNKEGVPCDKCDSCREISQGSNLDVLEIDGASNNGVDQIRDLRDNVKFLPARGPFKIYIIDEVHMLSIGAFNALLKTLEEPPPHVKFIFATTEPQKVPATILSRCQRFDLKRISTGDIASHLGKIAKAEGVKIDKDALLALARGAEGGLRDAESALDQVISFRGKEISEEDVLSVFGLVSREHLENICSAVLDNNIPDILTVIAELDEAGKDLQRLAAEVLEYFRNLLVISFAPSALNENDIPEEMLTVYREQAGRVEQGRLVRMVEQIIAAQSQLKFALSRRVVLEMALIKAARCAGVATLDEIMREIRDGAEIDDEAAPTAQKKSPEPTVTAARKPAPPPADEPPEDIAEYDETYDAPEEPVDLDQPVRSVTGQAGGGDADGSDELLLLANHWSHICEIVGHMAPLAKAYVRDTRPVALTDVTCTVGCDPEFAGHIPYLKHAKCIMAFQKAVADVLGRKVTVHVEELDQPQQGALPADTVVGNAGDTHAGESGDEGDVAFDGRSEETRKKMKWADETSVRNTMEMFNGRISDIRE